MLLVFGEVGEDVDVSLGQKGNRMYDPGGSSQMNAPFNKLGLERNNCCSQTKSQSHLHRFLSRLIPPWTLSKRPSEKKEKVEGSICTRPEPDRNKRFKIGTLVKLDAFKMSKLFCRYTLSIIRANRISTFIHGYNDWTCTGFVQALSGVIFITVVIEFDVDNHEGYQSEEQNDGGDRSYCFIPFQEPLFDNVVAASPTLL
ncbi:hypothetical protein GEV33_002856 [Tenebrio molitor]|uniref:Uncharacterized protein n=1 Tax=Tenebrio molitor TaxID=7067 RepID=A0A8J6LFP9_TENMO|nr:hypothetical protein GEV33_002856 [Tenebrio molitor]